MADSFNPSPGISASLSRTSDRRRSGDPVCFNPSPGISASLSKAFAGSRAGKMGRVSIPLQGLVPLCRWDDNREAVHIGTVFQSLSRD